MLNGHCGRTAGVVLLTKIGWEKRTEKRRDAFNYLPASSHLGITRVLRLCRARQTDLDAAPRIFGVPGPEAPGRPRGERGLAVSAVACFDP